VVAGISARRIARSPASRHKPDHDSPEFERFAMNFLASREQLRASLIRWALICVPACLLLGILPGRIWTADSAWFLALTKPAIYPPPAAFGIVWSVLFVMMGLALALVGSAWGARGRRIAIAAFVVQFAFNLAWTPTFFGAHQLIGGLFLLIAIVIAVAVTLVLFWRVRKLAGALLLPYLAWVLFAAALNYEFLRLNPQADGAEGGSGAAARVRIGD
jgi:translocator protein